MIIKLIGKLVRAYKLHSTTVTHEHVIRNILKDSGLCEQILKVCISKLIFNTAHTRVSKTHLPRLFSHDITTILDRRYISSMAFVMDEIHENLIKYKGKISAFEVYCIIGKYLYGK